MAERIGVSDEVWARLDPRAQPRSRRTRRTVFVAASVAIMLVTAWYLAAIFGVTRPQLSDGGSWSVEQSPSGEMLSQELNVTNSAWTSATVVGAKSPIPELGVTTVEGLPATIASGQTATITVHYRITDCSELFPRPSISYGLVERLELAVSRWWGTISVLIAEIPREIAAHLCHD